MFVCKFLSFDVFIFFGFESFVVTFSLNSVSGWMDEIKNTQANGMQEPFNLLALQK